MKKYKVNKSDDMGILIAGNYEIDGQHLVYRAMATERRNIQDIATLERLLNLVQLKLVVLLRPTSNYLLGCRDRFKTGT